ncbi:ferrous iron transport protein B [Vagococcus carniphilus]|uniref:ferrous iron transport protein B n=1 Tax=Vagococcus carniphilus TaxID=218144 RepID=UPI00289019CE|nr:ferrous iron transport protein B [Vagococcus carniphilus]MDT2815357.1 ferrous iron transport protein B [Vagococcus carniphilus]MDT2830664.1 ferrous iron transport protein B [Vagococcus carniphilus]MDT2839564.1 ferrous iron transport protein B [Vagococcus carniphilus]MDT2853827.1 ferrous iron transport protein B [Vagococcus carniphilus]MDT2866401.1 ferrous iron transport protein B [Vagococcus carniphilus]
MMEETTDTFVIQKKNESDRTIALAGNPNVGKSSIFNELTGMRQHTGNWPGKTVDLAQGYAQHKNQGYVLVDLPGTYSLMAHSQEEEVARDFIQSKDSEATIVVCDATSLERNLNLVLQIMQITPKVVVCVNLLDEAKKKKISIDLLKLQELLGVPVVGTSAVKKQGLDELMEKTEQVITGDIQANPYMRDALNQLHDDSETEILALLDRASVIANDVISYGKKDFDKKDRVLDKILTQKSTGIPIMILLLMLVFWFTIVGADGPSDFLADTFNQFGNWLTKMANQMNVPNMLQSVLIDGIYKVLSTVVAVMLPPMAIFFPIFTLLEDFGYLPRVAFNLDKYFQKAGACGKQALTMCMGFGCNAAGVVGARIIDSPRERLIAIVTNNFVPCNGRFPILIAVITMFFAGTSTGLLGSVKSAAFLTGVILLGVATTIWVSTLLSKTILKGLPSSFTLELPPYRKPQIGQVIVRSIFDRTLFVLWRAIIVAAPAGLVIWVLANIHIGDQSILQSITAFIDPFAHLMGLDGTILMAFILGLPANEIVIPIMIMGYMATSTITDFNSLNEFHQLLVNNGWTWLTATNVLLFTLYHWPCSTTLITIYKETKSKKWTFVSFIVPTAIGVGITMLTTLIAHLFHLV